MAKVFRLFREVGVSNGSLDERLVPAVSQSRRDCALQPRVARNELPWEIVQTASQPQRGCGRALHPRTQLRSSWLALARYAQGSSFLATLGFVAESLWDNTPSKSAPLAERPETKP